MGGAIMLFGEFVVGVLGQMLGELLGEVLEQPIERLRDDRALRRQLKAAVARAEQRFAQEYRSQDPELVLALTRDTRFADLPSVQAALRGVLTQPFHDPSQPVAVLHASFADVLPERVDRARVDAAVSTFLRILGQEVLYIPQLQQLYSLAFQKLSAESSRSIAAHTAALVGGIDGLRSELRQLPPPPPALALPAAPPQRPRPWHNLPQRSYSRFVGRQPELQQLARLLLPHPRSRHFVVTIDGVGGVGKSALALELAYGYRESYAALPETERFEAIIWISAKRTLLTADGIQQRRQTFTALDDLYRALATTLEQPALLQAPADDRRAIAERALANQRTLLILDNLETVDDEELLTFLRELPDPTKALVTTRHRIDIAYALRLTGMPYDDALRLMAVESQVRDVQLDAAAGDELFRRTGGIPLAIVWSIALIALGHGVEGVLRRLGSGQSDIARFCFGESVERIRGRDAERLLLALALFESGVSRPLLGDVAGLDQDVVGRDDGLAQLVQLSLVNQKGERFSLLPLTQAFALDALARQPALEQTLRARWVAHLEALAQPYADLHWRRPDRGRLRREGRHLAGLAAYAQRSEQLDVLLNILPALLSYYDLEGEWGTMLTVAALGLEQARLTGNARRMIETLIHGYAWPWSHQGRHAEAAQAVAEALDLAEELGDAALHCEVLVSCAQVERRRRQFAAGEERCQQALGLLPQLDTLAQEYVRANLEYERGKLARDQREWQRAQRHLLAAQDVFRQEDAEPRFNREFAWIVQCNLALIEHQLGELETAAQRYEQALAFFEELDDRAYLPTIQVRLAALEADRGNPQRAMALARVALAGGRRLGSLEEIAAAQQMLAQLERQPG